MISGVHSYRYRVTVEVDTPKGVRTGSSVWQVKAWEGSGIPDNGIRTRIRGEAVAVDLPGGTLFALLRGQDMDFDYPDGVVGGHLRKHPLRNLAMGRDWAENQREIARAKPAFELYPDEYPLLVHFRNLNDPASVEKAEPQQLASSLGPGVRLRRIVIAVTEERPKVGDIYSRLPWLETQKGSLVQMPPLMPVNQWPFMARIIDGDFIRR
jgi:hypothetical protein